MATPNIPNMTEPVSRTQASSIGVAGNIGANPGMGYSNNSKGGEVDTGNASFNTFPNNQALMAAVNLGGAGQGSSMGSSSNPAAPQAEVAIVTAQDAATVNVAQVSTGLLNCSATGYKTNIPTANNLISGEFSKVNGYTSAFVEAYPTNSAKGFDHNRTYIVDDLTRMAELKAQTLASSEEKKTDGAGQGANSVDKFVALGDNVQTASMNTLPDGKEISSQVGHE